MFFHVKPIQILTHEITFASKMELWTNYGLFVTLCSPQKIWDFFIVFPMCLFFSVLSNFPQITSFSSLSHQLFPCPTLRDPKTMRPKLLFWMNVERERLDNWQQKVTHTNTVHERFFFWFLSKVYRAFFSFNGRRFDALLWTEVNLAVRAFSQLVFVSLAVVVTEQKPQQRQDLRVRSKRSAQHGLRSFNVSFHARSSRDHCSYSHRGSRATSQPSHGRTRPSNHYNQTPDTFWCISRKMVAAGWDISVKFIRGKCCCCHKVFWLDCRKIIFASRACRQMLLKMFFKLITKKEIKF